MSVQPKQKPKRGCLIQQAAPFSFFSPHTTTHAPHIPANHAPAASCPGGAGINITHDRRCAPQSWVTSHPTSRRAGGTRITQTTILPTATLGSWENHLLYMLYYLLFAIHGMLSGKQSILHQRHYSHRTHATRHRSDVRAMRSHMFKVHIAVQLKSTLRLS